MDKTVYNIIEFNQDTDFNQKDITNISVTNFGDTDLYLVFNTGVKLKLPKYNAVNEHARAYVVPVNNPFDIQFTVQFDTGSGKAVIDYHQIYKPNNC